MLCGSPWSICLPVNGVCVLKSRVFQGKLMVFREIVPNAGCWSCSNLFRYLFEIFSIPLYSLHETLMFVSLPLITAIAIVLFVLDILLNLVFLDFFLLKCIISRNTLSICLWFRVRLITWILDFGWNIFGIRFLTKLWTIVFLPYLNNFISYFCNLAFDVFELSTLFFYLEVFFLKHLVYASTTYMSVDIQALLFEISNGVQKFLLLHWPI